MTETQTAGRYRFGVFEADPSTGELRRQGMRVKLHAQPFQVLVLLLRRPGELLTREEICRELWPDGVFVDYEQGVNSTVNRLREALGDKASNPRFIETLARRGYRFIAPVEHVLTDAPVPEAQPQMDGAAEPVAQNGFFDRLLATPADLPKSPRSLVLTLFVLLQAMYLSFYISALANLPEIEDLLSALPFAARIFVVLIVTAAILIPARVFLLCAVVFRAPRLHERYLKLWWILLPLDLLWALSPFLLLHHISYGLALACVPLLIYSPFAQRSLILTGTIKVSE